MDDLNQLIVNLSKRDDCPWSPFTPGSLQFCEEQLCSVITAPAETWTNVLYFVIGFFILRKLPRERAFGWIAIIVGYFSTLFHASHVLWAETLDLAAMNILGAYLLTRNIGRLRFPKMSQLQLPQPSIFHRGSLALFLGFFILSGVALLFSIGEARLSVFGSFIAFTLATEFILWQRSQKSDARHEYRWYGLTVAFLIPAYLFWQLDYRGIVCDPQNHFLSGHGVWHLLNAVCFYTLARFYGSIGKGSPLTDESRSNPSEDRHREPTL